MIVCVCNAVTESEIRACVEFGCRDLEQVRDVLGVADNCGCCADCAQALIETCSPREPETTT
jgi:bacterioferritin-associated ferredoxin